MKRFLLLCCIILSTQTYAQQQLSADSVAYIKKESAPGGELDFSRFVTEQEQIFVFDGMAYNRKDFIYLIWAQKVRSLGVRSADDAIALRSEIDKRKLTEPEIKALTKGYNTIMEE